MNKKLYWGLGVLFLLIIGGFVFLLVQQKAELAKYEADYALPTEKVADKKTPQNEQELDTSDPNSHVHSDGTPHVGTHGTPIAQGAAPVTTYNGPLTFHAELLKTNPVKALRLQAEERGHVNAKWIPPFPPDDQEAQAFARNLYLSTYLDETDPEYEKAAMAWREQLRAIDEKYPYGARLMDLSKLLWVGSSRTLSHYNRGGTAKSPSDYFPLHISDLK